MTNTQKELVKETDRSLLQSKSDSYASNNSRTSISTITKLILEQDGDFTFHPDQQLRLRHRIGSSTTIGNRIKVGILGEPHPGLNSLFLPASVDRYTCHTPHFLMHRRCTACSLVCVQSHHAHAWLKIGVYLLCPTYKHFILARHVPCFAALFTKNGHSFHSFSGPSISNPLPRSTTSSG